MRIFLSYRRQDPWAASAVHRIYERLGKHFGEENVFIDVDTIPPGRDFRQVLKEEVAKTDVLLAVMGDQWATLLQERAQENADFVRIEIESALELKLPVVPVLIGQGTRMPAERQLPESLRAIPYLQGVMIDPGRDLPSHVQRLIADLERFYSRKPDSGKPEPVPAPAPAPAPPPTSRAAPEKAPPAPSPVPAPEPEADLVEVSFILPKNQKGANLEEVARAALEVLIQATEVADPRDGRPGLILEGNPARAWLRPDTLHRLQTGEAAPWLKELGISFHPTPSISFHPGNRPQA